MVGKDSLERDRLMPWYGGCFRLVFFSTNRLAWWWCERGGPGSVQRGWPAAENSDNGFPLLFSHVSQFERNALLLAIY